MIKSIYRNHCLLVVTPCSLAPLLFMIEERLGLTIQLEVLLFRVTFAFPFASLITRATKTVTLRLTSPGINT
jgi:hypothetical protein